MAAPLKPWERAGVNQQNDRPCCKPGANQMSGAPMAAGLPPGLPGSAPIAQPPPLPPRPSSYTTSTFNRFGSNYGYGGMGYGGIGMYNSPYSSYGGYGYGMNRYGMGGEPIGTFARQAEESSRPAFESIESIVNAFTSVSMMLDSTFQAVYNSFRAVIGVADNFSKLKLQIMQVVSALAFVRTLKYMYRRLLEFLALRPPGSAVEEWNRAFQAAAAQAGSAGPSGKKSSWPIMMFFGIILGGPWLIWKLLSSFSTTSTKTPTWANGQEDHFVADVLYDFNGETNEEIAVKAGQRIIIAPKEFQPQVRGWLLASNDEKTGLVPASYVRVLGKRKGLTNEQSITANDTPIQQTTSSLNLAQSQPSATDNEMENMFSDSLPIVSSDVGTNQGQSSNSCEKKNTESCCHSKPENSGIN